MIVCFWLVTIHSESTILSTIFIDWTLLLVILILQVLFGARANHPVMLLVLLIYNSPTWSRMVFVLV